MRFPTSRMSTLPGTVVGVALVGVIAAALVPARGSVTEAVPALALVLPVVLAGLLAGRLAALMTSLVATAALNAAFVRPYWTLKVAFVDDVVALSVFVIVAVAVGTLVAVEGQRRRSAEQRAAEIEDLYARLAKVADERERLAEETTRLQVLERVDESRRALLRSVSHDLRTPLATIRAVATDLRDGVVYDEQTRSELLESVCLESERLDRLVANLLSMSRIEAGALQPELQAIDVGELASECLRRLNAVLKDVRVQTDIPASLPLARGDYSQLDQVLTNLLENAARHAPPGSTVRVSACPRRDRIEVSVADEGIGVPDFAAERIFLPFRTGEGSTSTGLGLAISQALVQAHGGSLRVERTPGGGATFVFDIASMDAAAMEGAEPIDGAEPVEAVDEAVDEAVKRR